MAIWNKLALLVVFFLFFTGFTYGQKKRIEKADLYFASGEYFKAQELYIKAYAKAKDKISQGMLSFKIGETYRLINDPKNAEKWYRKAVSKKYSDPKATLYLADMLKMKENYEDAMAFYASYKDLVPDDPRGQAGLESCKLAMEWIQKPGRFIVYQARQFCDKESDFKVSYGEDTTEIYFTSAREGATGNTINDNSGMFFTDIFVAKRDKKGKWSIPVPVTGGVNTAFDEGAAFVTAQGKRMYYTSCKVIKNQSVGCQIYFSDFNGETWGAPEWVKLFADSSISVGHPCLSDDELLMYFVAETKEGLGGKDIWMTKRDSKASAWEKPINAGESINTAANEMSPFIHPDGSLYFSSNGMGGMGGLDIFKATREGEKWVVENMKYPINSAADDFGIVFYKNEKTGYLSSSRPGSRSDDIYHFYQPPVILSIKGIVKNDINYTPINQALVKMTGSDGTQLETETGANGMFTFSLHENTDYVFIASRDHFLKGLGKESTKGITENKVLEIEILMTPTSEIVEVQNIEYDFGKWNLREESKVALDLLVELLEINSNITIELRSHTDFRGNDKDNLELSSKRANSVVEYLITKNIKADRLVARGYGETEPVTVSKKLAAKYPFLKEGDILNEQFITALTTTQEKEIAHQLNRRTEFKVLSVDYIETGIPFGSDGNK